MDLVDRVAAALQRSVLPSVIARGGAVRVVAVDDGVATLEVRGSPGAVLLRRETVTTVTASQGVLRADDQAGASPRLRGSARS